MASVGHVAVGMVAARVSDNGASRVRSWAAWSALSLLPDVDAIGFAVGIPYAHPWGHRGATHSLTFALALGVLVALAARVRNRPFGRTALVACLVLSSHPLLDTMTDGGLGCALFWPFDSTRYFAPWRPIPVAPIGLGFFTQGAPIVLTELVLFAPLLAFAARPPTARFRRAWVGALLPFWLVCSWLVASRDPLREAVIGRLLQEDTAYSRDFNERRFAAIVRGQSEREVRQRLGPPFAEGWFYVTPDGPSVRATERSAASAAGCMAVSFENGLVVAATDRPACAALGIKSGMTRDDVVRLLGAPAESCWRYTWSPRGARYRMRMVCFADGKVGSVFRRWE